MLFSIKPTRCDIKRNRCLCRSGSTTRIPEGKGLYWRAPYSFLAPIVNWLCDMPYIPKVVTARECLEQSETRVEPFCKFSPPLLLVVDGFVPDLSQLLA
jgi:hypothetical protein